MGEVQISCSQWKDVFRLGRPSLFLKLGYIEDSLKVEMALPSGNRKLFGLGGNIYPNFQIIVSVFWES